MLQENIRRLESIVHPLVAEHRHSFLQSVAEQTSQKLVVLDIPLLFETKGEHEVTMQAVDGTRELAYPFDRACTDMCWFLQVDSIAVVSASSEVQRGRVLARPGMTAGKEQNTPNCMLYL